MHPVLGVLVVLIVTYTYHCVYSFSPPPSKAWVFVCSLVSNVVYHLRRWWYAFSQQGTKLAIQSFDARKPHGGEDLVREINNGRVSLLWPLGVFFEENDDEPQAALVYNVLEQRAHQDGNAYLTEQAAERADLINMSRNVPSVVSVPVVLRTPTRPIMLNPPQAPVKRKPATSTKIPPPPVRGRSDPHNTHDSGVTASVKASYRDLKHSVYPFSVPVEQCLKEIRELCVEQNRADALKTLDTIEKSTSLVSALDDESEACVLCTVYNRFTQQGYDTDLLLQRLSDCVEGSVVCTSGRVTRIVDSLNVVDPLVSIKPRWAVRQEINMLAAKLRQEENDDQTFKNRLREQCENDYVKTNLLSKPLLDLELEWLNDL